MNKFTLNKNNAVFMILDIQTGLIPAMEKHIAHKVVNNTNILISAAKEFKIPIITTEQYPKGLGPTISDLSTRIDSSLIFEKISFTGITPDVKQVLTNLDKKQIIVAGMETHICVFQTVRDLLNQGYEVFVLEDGVCSRTRDNYKNGLSLMKEMGAMIVNTETVVFDLLKEAGTPEFKLLSNLIK